MNGKCFIDLSQKTLAIGMNDASTQQSAGAFEQQKMVAGKRRAV
jgi:hypothetical protein